MDCSIFIAVENNVLFSCILAWISWAVEPQLQMGLMSTCYTVSESEKLLHKSRKRETNKQVWIVYSSSTIVFTCIPIYTLFPDLCIPTFSIVFTGTSNCGAFGFQAVQNTKVSKCNQSIQSCWYQFLSLLVSVAMGILYSPIPALLTAATTIV